MKKIECKIGDAKGYIFLDDDLTFLGTAWEVSGDQDSLEWRWKDARCDAFGRVSKLSDAIKMLKYYK